MPYNTFAETAAAVGGVQRLTSTVMVGHEDETLESHPFFDDKVLVADQEVDTALDSAGYETPLDSITDAKLKNAHLGVLLGLLSETSSAREQWMIDLEASGRAYLAQIAARQVAVIGAEPLAEEADGGIFGQLDETPLFAIGDPSADVNSVYADLGPGPRSWRRWR